MNKIVILIIFILLFSSANAIAQNPEIENYSIFKNVKIITVHLDSLINNNTPNDDIIEPTMDEIREESDRIYDNLVKALNNPVDEAHNQILINEYEELNSLYPHDKNYKSEYVSDDFIFGLYYELPLLKKYREYTDELSTVISTIQGLLLSPETQKLSNLDPFRKVTNKLLLDLSSTGKHKLKNGKNISFQYAPYYKKRDKEASIQYLNDQIDSLQSIINNRKLDITEMDLQLTMLQQRLFPKNSARKRESYFEEIIKEAHENKKKNESSTQKIQPGQTNPVASPGSQTSNPTTPPYEGEQDKANQPINPPGKVIGNGDNVASDKDNTNNDNPSLAIEKPNSKLDPIITKQAVNVFKKQLDDLMKSVDLQVIIDTNEFEEKIDERVEELKKKIRTDNPNNENPITPEKTPNSNRRLDKNTTKNAVNAFKKQLDALMKSVDLQVIKDTKEFEEKIDEWVKELKKEIKKPVSD